jgi:hypothetical protein
MFMCSKANTTTGIAKIELSLCLSTMEWGGTGGVEVKPLAKKRPVQWTQNNSELGLRHSKGEDRATGRKTAKSLSEHVSCNWKHFPLLISTQSVAFWYTDFYTALYFVNHRTYKTLAMQAHALTRMRYFYSLNVIISHPTVQGSTELSLRPCCRFAVFISCVSVTVNEARSYFASTVPTGQQAWWAAEPVWRRWRREEIMPLPGLFCGETNVLLQTWASWKL